MNIIASRRGEIVYNVKRDGDYYRGRTIDGLTIIIPAEELCLWLPGIYPGLVINYAFAKARVISVTPVDASTVRAVLQFLETGRITTGRITTATIPGRVVDPGVYRYRYQATPNRFSLIETDEVYPIGPYVIK